MEHCFKKAIDFLDGTGAGIIVEASLRAAVTKICPYYYELEPVMSERSSSQALVAKKMICHGRSSDSSSEDNTSLTTNSVLRSISSKRSTQKSPFGIPFDCDKEDFEKIRLSLMSVKIN